MKAPYDKVVGYALTNLRERESHLSGSRIEKALRRHA
jgi:hypothetical protein